MSQAQELANHVRGQLARVIVGQQEVLDHLFLVLLVGGHALVEGVPGLAKTLAVKALANIFQLKFQRVQCTPDLMPADECVQYGHEFLCPSSWADFHRSIARR